MSAFVVLVFVGSLALPAAGFFHWTASRRLRPIWLSTVITLVLLTCAALTVNHICFDAAKYWLVKNMAPACLAGSISWIFCSLADYVLAGRFVIIFVVSMFEVFLIMSASVRLLPKLLTREV